MNKCISSPVQAFLAIVIILSCGIYGLSDYYLNSLGEEMMLNWAKTEALSIQDGNLLSSVTKSQPYLASSSYVKGVQLLKSADDQFNTRIALGAPFESKLPLDNELTDKPAISRVGFLHSQVFYKIPSEPDFVLVFDLESPVLTFAFFGAVAVLVLLLIGLISLLRIVESKESHKRERLLKLAISDLITKDAATDLLDNQFPEVADWWRAKKVELTEANRIAAENDSKILLGEMASRLAHDIKNPLRNIRILAKRTSGLDESQTTNFYNSISKIEAITSTVSKRTREILRCEANGKSIVEIRSLIEKTIAEKSGNGRAIRFNFDNAERIECYLNSLEFERSLSNLIGNAVDATRSRGSVTVTINRNTSSVEISVEDSGKGISSGDLPKVGVKGFTYGKPDGTGLGVYYARKFIEESGGTLSINSILGKGTNVNIVFPIVNEAVPVPLEIRLNRGMSLAVLDDDPIILAAVQAKMQPLDLKSKGIDFKLFQKASTFESWLRTIENEVLVVTDFNLDGEAENGLDIIERLDLATKSWVFTSAPEDEKLQSKARRLGVPVIGKDAFFEMHSVLS